MTRVGILTTLTIFAFSQVSLARGYDEGQHIGATGLKKTLDVQKVVDVLQQKITEGSNSDKEAHLKLMQEFQDAKAKKNTLAMEQAKEKIVRTNLFGTYDMLKPAIEGDPSSSLLVKSLKESSQKKIAEQTSRTILTSLKAADVRNEAREWISKLPATKSSEGQAGLEPVKFFDEGVNRGEFQARELEQLNKFSKAWQTAKDSGKLTYTDEAGKEHSTPFNAEAQNNAAMILNKINMNRANGGSPEAYVKDLARLETMMTKEGADVALSAQGMLAEKEIAHTKAEIIKAIEKLGVKLSEEEAGMDVLALASKLKEVAASKGKNGETLLADAQLEAKKRNTKDLITVLKEAIPNPKDQVEFVRQCATQTQWNDILKYGTLAGAGTVLMAGLAPGNKAVASEPAAAAGGDHKKAAPALNRRSVQD